MKLYTIQKPSKYKGLRVRDYLQLFANLIILRIVERNEKKLYELFLNIIQLQIGCSDREQRTGEGVGEAEKNRPTKSRKFRQKQKGITGRDRDVHPKVVSLNDFSAVIINKANIRKAGINDE